MYKYDTHVHTAEVSPCGKVNAAEVVRLYKKAGYSGIVLTDHYYEGYFHSLPANKWEDKVDFFLEGYRTALKEGQKSGLDVILGMEIRFNENFNDYLIYGFDEDFLYKNPKLYTNDLKSFRQLIDGTGIQIYQAHPFRAHISPADPRYLDGVEVYNGNARHNSQNHKALEFAKTKGLRMSSGSDFHQPEDLATGGIDLAFAPKNSIEFVEAIKQESNFILLQFQQNCSCGAPIHSRNI